MPPSEPLAVQQWGGLLAVNYTARAFGVRRGMRVEEALAKCPTLHTPHVPVIGEAPAVTVASTSATMTTNIASTDSPRAGAPPAPSRELTKISLERYRHESSRIFSVLEELAPVLERVSIDEAYVDVTELASMELARGKTWVRSGARPTGRSSAESAGDDNGHGGGGSSHVSNKSGSESDEDFNDEPGRWAGQTDWIQTCDGDERWRPNPDDPFDRHLLAAAAVCAQLRQAVLERTGYCMSAGIAHSKLVAKIASAKHKPNRQTIIPRAAVPLVMATLPLKELRGLGGQLGDKIVAALGVTYAGELAEIPQARLRSEFGVETAAWLATACRGGASDVVKPSLAPKSLNAFKSFAATQSDEIIRRWVRLLSSELVDRMVEDRAVWSRMPRRLRLQSRGSLNADHKDHWIAGRTAELTHMQSRQCSLPGGGRRIPTADQINSAALELLRTLCEGGTGGSRGGCRDGGARGNRGGPGHRGDSSTEKQWPTLTRLALSVCNFVPVGQEGRSVASFFHAASSRQAAREHAPSLVSAPASSGCPSGPYAAAIDGPEEGTGRVCEGRDVEIVPWDDYGEDAEVDAYEDAEEAEDEAAEKAGVDYVDEEDEQSRWRWQEVEHEECLRWAIPARTWGERLEDGEWRSGRRTSEQEELARCDGAGEEEVDVTNTLPYGSMWQCRRCTFLNSSLLPACEMCDLDRNLNAGVEPRSMPSPKRKGAHTTSKASKRPKLSTAIGLQAYGFVSTSGAHEG